MREKPSTNSKIVTKLENKETVKYIMADGDSSMTNNEKSIMNDYVNIMKYIEDNEPSEYKIYGLKIRLKNFLRQFLK